MSADRVPEISPRILDALDELKAIILGRYPDATFSVGPSPEDPDVVHLYATVDLEDTEEFVDLVIDRMMEMQIEDGLPIFVIPERPPERVRQMLAVARRRSRQQGSALLD